MGKIIQILNCWDSEHKEIAVDFGQKGAEGKETLEKLYDKLYSSLDEETKKTFWAFLEANDADWVLETDAFYERGFKTGFWLAMELRE